MIGPMSASYPKHEIPPFRTRPDCSRPHINIYCPPLAACSDGIEIYSAARMGAPMKCLRIYSTPDGESHFDEVDIPTTSRRVHPAAAAVERSARYPTTHVSFTHIPAGAGEVDWHTVPGRVLTVRLNGSAEYYTSDGDSKHVPAGSFILFEDTHGKGHKTEHSPEEQTVIWIYLPHGLDQP